MGEGRREVSDLLRDGVGDIEVGKGARKVIHAAEEVFAEDKVGERGREAVKFLAELGVGDEVSEGRWKSVDWAFKMFHGEGGEGGREEVREGVEVFDAETYQGEVRCFWGYRERGGHYSRSRRVHSRFHFKWNSTNIV